MPRDFIPRRDADFLQFTANFAETIAPPTDPASLGLTPAQVAHYALTQQAFAAAYDAASAPGTRTVVTVGAKNTARQTLEDESRMLAGIIRAHPGITNTMLCDLHMSVPVDKRRRRVPAPTVAPLLSAEQKHGLGGRLEILLRGLESGRVGKPRDVTGALIMGYASMTGEKPPADPMNWSLLKQTSRSRVRVAVGLPGGTRLWLTACWCNTHSERGPWCEPIETRINFGGIMDKDAVPVRGLQTPLKFATAESVAVPAPAPALLKAA